MDSKQMQRAFYLDKRKKLSIEQRQQKSKKIQNVLLQDKLFLQALWVYTYISMPMEVDTVNLIQTSLELGKRVAVPITRKQNRLMYFVEIKSFLGLQKTKIGVLEPVASIEKECIPKKGDFFIVPGVAFDKDGNRLGYGGGFYDTYFDRVLVDKKIALAFSVQIADEVATDNHDKKMDVIITESKKIFFEKHNINSKSIRGNSK